MMRQIANGLPTNTGNWADDCAAGRRHAAKLIEHMRENENPIRLSRIAEHMAATGRFGGVENGFFHEFAEQAIRD